jgi:hypothetical protein
MWKKIYSHSPSIGEEISSVANAIHDFVSYVVGGYELKDEATRGNPYCMAMKRGQGGGC